MRCGGTYAAGSKNETTVYGSAGNVSTYSANDYGMVNMRDVAANPDSSFVVADGQRLPEEYLNLMQQLTRTISRRTVHGLIRTIVSSFLRRLHTNWGSSMGSCQKRKRRALRGHRGGQDADWRYMDPNGQDLRGPSASANGDPGRGSAVVNSVGRQNAITGDSAKYGSTPVSDPVRRQHLNHIPHKIIREP
jgi:hypothetical protein